jgi:hypothetical protein
MFARLALFGSVLALATSGALAAGPARTPGVYTLKTNNPAQNEYTVTQITLDTRYDWDSDSYVRTTFNNRPDAAGRGNPMMTFMHQNGRLVSAAEFSSTSSPDGARAFLEFRRVGTMGSTRGTQNAGPDANGRTVLDYRFSDNEITAQFYFHAERFGYDHILRNGGAYGAAGFFGVPDEFKTGAFTSGLTTFRFESNQDVGTARLLYNFANDGGESGTVRARLYYLDRNGSDGFNKIRYTYVSNASTPVSRN